MDMELSDSGLDWLDVGKQDMNMMKGDLMGIGTFADSLSDLTSFLGEERMTNLDIFLYDKTHCNKETFPSDLATAVNNGSSRNLSLEAFFDSPFPLGQDVETFSSFDHQSCEVLMSSPLSCNDLESVFNTDVTTDGLHAKPVPICTLSSLESIEEQQLVDNVELLKSESNSSDTFSSLHNDSGITHNISSSPSHSGTESYNFDINSPSSSTGFSSQPVSPFPLEIFPPDALPQLEILPVSPQTEKFQGKAKRSKSYRTKNNSNHHSPYNLSSKSTESPSLPSSSLLPNDSTSGVELQQLSKKERKRLQNKNAAIRYRQKMKAEAKTRVSEEEELLAENLRLKEKVEDLQREIRYVANLMEEVKKARSKSSRSS